MCITCNMRIIYIYKGSIEIRFEIQKGHSKPHPHIWAMECLSWVCCGQNGWVIKSCDCTNILYGIFFNSAILDGAENTELRILY